MRPVTHDVNKVGNNDTHLIEPLPRGHEQPVPLAIASQSDPTAVRMHDREKLRCWWR
jgi:hypothetical protein